MFAALAALAALGAGVALHFGIGETAIHKSTAMIMEHGRISRRCFVRHRRG